MTAVTKPEAERAQQKTSEVRSDYDRLAPQYARHLYDELQHKPLDRELLDRFADRVRGKGPVCDLGCGPGQVARYLQRKKVEVSGIDLSSGMIAEARRLNPSLEFTPCDMLALPIADESWAGITAFYAIVNFPPADLLRVLGEMRRVLQPGGCLLLGFHIGDKVEHVEDLWGCRVSLDFYFFGVEQVTVALREAGFEIDEAIERGPYSPEFEYQSRRAYIFARKSAQVQQ